MLRETWYSGSLEGMPVAQDEPGRPPVVISEPLLAELAHTFLYPLQHKAFGLVGGKDLYHPSSMCPYSANLRKMPEWKSIFESHGELHRDPDQDFDISAPEVKQMLDRMALHNEAFFGVSHPHRFLPAEPSAMDPALNSDPDLLSYIVSVVDPSVPVVGVFRLNGGSFQNIPIKRVPKRE